MIGYWTFLIFIRVSHRSIEDIICELQITPVKRTKIFSLKFSRFKTLNEKQRVKLIVYFHMLCFNNKKKTGPSLVARALFFFFLVSVWAFIKEKKVLCVILCISSRSCDEMSMLELVYDNFIRYSELLVQKKKNV